MADKLQADQRRQQGFCIAALSAATAELRADVRGELRLQEPDDAMRELAAAVDDGALRIPRLFVLDSLVKFARRRGEDLQANDKALDELLTALVRRAGVPLAASEDAAAAVRRALDSVSRPSAVEPVEDSWAVFAQQAAAPLQLTQAEIEKPLCNDGEDVSKGNQTAVGITVEFHTDATPGDLRHFCDPTRWHECSAHQREMTPLPGGVDRRRQDGWRRDLYETVDLTPAVTLVTPLRFTYSIQDAADPRWVHLDYVLLTRTNDIVIDEGALDVRRVTSGRHKGRTRVTAKKAILFDGLLEDWPTIACDTFWTDMVITAAVGCPGDGGTPPTPGGIRMPDTPTDKLDKVIEAATKSAQKSVAAYADIAKEAATRLAGGTPADTGAWLQLTAKTYAQAAGDSATAFKTYNEVLGILADQAGPTP